MDTSRPADRSLWSVALLAFFVVATGAVLVDDTLKGKPVGLASFGAPPLFLGPYFLFFALPAGFPALLIGVSRAAGLLKRSGRRSLVIWMLRGVATGALLGVLGVCSWFGLLNIATPADFVKEVPELALVGAGCGASIGLAVGVRCWDLSRQPARRPLPC